MPFEVLYSYADRKEEVLILDDTEAKSLDEAEKVALEKLDTILPEDVNEVELESIRAI